MYYFEAFFIQAKIRKVKLLQFQEYFEASIISIV